jgi:2H phosphodiesterase-like protein
MMKSFIQKIFIVLILTAALSSSAFAKEDYQVENQPHVIETVVQFQQKGILKQKDNGYLYVEVSKDYISETLPLIDAQGKIVPPRHYTSKKGIGAHISVMYENEQILNEIWEIKELGQEFTFSVMELRTVKLNKNNKVQKLWLVAVSAPELEKLREGYGLPSKLKGHDFHITIGTQVPGKPQVRAEEIIFEGVEELEEAA